MVIWLRAREEFADNRFSTPLYWGEPERAPHVRVVQRARLYIYIYIYIISRVHKR